MTYEVVNGAIPEVVERWLLARAVRISRHEFSPRLWRVSGMAVIDEVTITGDGEWFDWPHDKAPNLQQAIEAVARARS